MINPNNLCPGCMEELKSGANFCAKCGYRIGKEEVNPRCLPPYTILAGKYLLGKVLGEGGFGVTYLGWDLNLEMKVAIKEYFPTGLATRDTTNTTMTQLQILPGNAKTYYDKGLAKYTEEAKLLSRFAKEDGIVSIKDYIYENGTAYIVMEYIDGESLKSEMERMSHPYSEELVIKRIMPILNVLEHVHAVGIMHRDISPDNIMIEKGGKVRLIDFGAARVATGDDNKSLTIMLKHGYAPEEQYRTKGQQGPWTDVYSICATMYRMLTGEVPEDAMDRLYQDKLKLISQFPTNCSPELNRILMKGLSVRANQRYQSIAELRREIALIPSSSNPAARETVDPPIQEMTQSLLCAEKSRKEWEEWYQSLEKEQIPPEKQKMNWGAFLSIVVITIFLILLIVGLGSGNESSNAKASDEIARPVEEVDEVINFTDANIEAAVMESLGQTAGLVYRSDMEKIVSLQCEGCTTLEDLAACKNLEELYINYSVIDNPKGIQNLSSLQTLYIRNSHISNLSFLTGLTDLVNLSLVWNSITDLNPLSGMQKLSYVNISVNPINDISVLNTLPMLEEVRMDAVPAADGYDRYLPNVTWEFSRYVASNLPLDIHKEADMLSEIIDTIPENTPYWCGPVSTGGSSNWQMVNYGSYYGYIYNPWNGQEH